MVKWLIKIKNFRQHSHQHNDAYVTKNQSNKPSSMIEKEVRRERKKYDSFFKGNDGCHDS